MRNMKHCPYEGAIEQSRWITIMILLNTLHRWLHDFLNCSRSLLRHSNKIFILSLSISDNSSYQNHIPPSTILQLSVSLPGIKEYLCFTLSWKKICARTTHCSRCLLAFNHYIRRRGLQRVRDHPSLSLEFLASSPLPFFHFHSQSSFPHSTFIIVSLRSHRRTGEFVVKRWIFSSLTIFKIKRHRLSSHASIKFYFHFVFLI